MDVSRIDRAAPRRLRARVLVLPLLALSCSYFPSHEEVYIPIPLDVGQPLIENGDTNYVLTGPGFRMIAPRQQILADARHDLESAVRQFELYFGESPDEVTVRYVDSLDARDLREREIERLAGRTRYEGEIVLPARRMPTYRGDRNPPPPAAAPAAARRWIIAHARRTADAARGDASATDTIRIPAWIATAMSDLVAYGTAPNTSARDLWERRSNLLDLRTLFSLDRLDPERNPEDRISDRDIERLTLRRLQSTSVARYMVEREDARYLGTVAERLFSGRSIDEALQGAQVLPTDLEELEHAWRAWIEQVATRR